MATATSELLWLRRLLSSLHITPSSPMTLHCDNHAALQIAANPMFHECTKHVEIDCHFVCERIQFNDIITS